VGGIDLAPAAMLMELGAIMGGGIMSSGGASLG